VGAVTIAILRVKKSGPGHPPHAPTDQQRAIVKVLAACGTPQEAIARVIGIHGETLRIHYRNELDLGAIEANAKVAEALFKLAVGGDVTAAIWWSKCRMGWGERQAVEHSGLVSLGVSGRRAGVQVNEAECDQDRDDADHSYCLKRAGQRS
jgi:hypothetical protein